MQVRLFDTLSRTEKALSLPAEGARLSVYACGPTVYGPAHIGNFLTFVRLDVLYRLLRVLGYRPFYIRNITDVDDKTIRGAREAGQPLGEFTTRWTRKFHEDCARLGMLPPDAEPRATAHIPAQVTLVERLLDLDLAYVSADGSVYFNVRRYGDYGRLSHFDPEQLRSQETNSAGRANLSDEYERESVADFALWKAWKPEDGEVAWAGPRGIKGRPGWHLECSAMSRAVLEGESLPLTLDLHAGGEDLIFPHHENEIAQSVCAYHGGHLNDDDGHPHFARHWMHCTHLLVEGRKMSKSLGNFFTLDDLLAQGHRPDAVRYALLGGHYRQQYNFTLAGLAGARGALDSLTSLVRGVLKAAQATALPEPSGADIEGGQLEPVWKALIDDLNTPAALGALFTALRGLKEADAGTAKDHLWSLAGLLFALGITIPAEGPVIEAPDEVRRLAAARWEAKQARNWAEADRLRGEVARAGWQVLDRKDGYDLKPL